MTVTPDEFAEVHFGEREGKTGEVQVGNSGWKSQCGGGRGGGKWMSKQRKPQKQGQMPDAQVTNIATATAKFSWGKQK